MSLTPLFTIAGALPVVENFINKQVEKSIEKLAYVGESFVNLAREIGTYTDRTGNLRSSIGYVIIYNGKIVRYDIKKARNGTEKSGGIERARELISQFAAEYPTGLVLIGFAGMEYAAAVESKGYDVITGSVPPSEELLNELRGLGK